MKFQQFFHPISLRRDLRRLMREKFKAYLKTDMVVYDIGCGSKPFQDDLKNKVEKHIGVDIEDGFYNDGNVDIIGTAYEVPVDEGVADAVISSQVIEHLERPIDAIKEANRLLKIDGLFFLSFPFLYPLHAAPYDYMRYTEFYIRNVLEENGFEVVEYDHLGGFWYTLGVFFEIYLNAFNRGILKKLYLLVFVRWIIQSILYTFHVLEKFGLKLLGKDPDNSREHWTVNQVLVVRKTKPIS
ncbi:MAG: class I SAM-dependent methyltransferase [Hyphomicrobiales bacterium]